MSDDLKDHGGRDRDRIDVSQEWECRYWTGKFGVSAEELKEAVRQVGDRAEDVERHLSGSASSGVPDMGTVD